MLAIGTFHTLRIARATQVGLFLSDGKVDVLLPTKYVPKAFEIGDELRVFVYLDHEERPVATTLEPYVSVNNFAFLRVNYTNQFGAFLDWGLEKDLFVPFQEQARKMEVGKRYFVYVFLDHTSNRLVASSKLNQFLNQVPATYEPGEEVTLLFSHKTDLGINVIVNKQHKGLIYADEWYDEKFRPGDAVTGYVKLVRPDGKIDVSLQQQGFQNIEPNAQKILDELKGSRGFLRLHDNSHPEDIKTVLKMSKKTFKKAVGVLYKQKRIEIKEDGIYLIA